MSFSGHSVCADSAAYGFACALNRIEWMAGDRSLPDDGVVTWNHAPPESDFGKYRGKRFSEVIAEDADYVTWARKQEEKGRTPRWGRPCLEASVSEGVRLWRRPCLEASVSGGVRVCG